MLKVINTDINSQNLNKWVPFVYIVYISTISSRRGLLSKLIKLILRLILEHSKPFLVHSLVTFSSAWVTFLALLVVWMGKSHTWLWFSFPLSDWFSAFTFWLFLSLFLVSNFGPLLFCPFVCLLVLCCLYIGGLHHHRSNCDRRPLPLVSSRLP